MGRVGAQYTSYVEFYVLISFCGFEFYRPPSKYHVNNTVIILAMKTQKKEENKMIDGVPIRARINSMLIA